MNYNKFYMRMALNLIKDQPASFSNNNGKTVNFTNFSLSRSFEIYFQCNSENLK